MTRRGWMRVRLVAIGALVVAATGVGGMWAVARTSESVTASLTMPISPCRLLDTRPAPTTVGTRAVPLNAGETLTVAITGRHGACVIPEGTPGVVANVTAVDGSADSYLTVWPAGASRPVSSNLNWRAGQSPTPNLVTAALSDDGKLNLFNELGTVNVIIDITAYLVTPATAGLSAATGPQGPPGPAGPPGRDASRCAATLRWDLAVCRQADYALPAGARGPAGIVYDGTHLWVTNTSTDNLARIDPATGTGTIVALPSGAEDPRGIVYDGTWLWTANKNNLTRVDPDTGAGTNFSLPSGPLVFDGTSLWAAHGGNKVTRIDRSTGVGTTFALPAGAEFVSDIAFDGTQLWTANHGSNNVTRIDPATGAGSNFALPADAVQPGSIGFDGTFVWVTNSSNVTRIDPSSGAGVNFALPAPAFSPFALVFDGTSLWALTGMSRAIRIDPSTGLVTNVVFPAGYTSDLAFDGTNIWTASLSSNGVIRLVP